MKLIKRFRDYMAARYGPEICRRCEKVVHSELYGNNRPEESKELCVYCYRVMAAPVRRAKN